ncbi:Major facilitator superfamily domain general substrate transporter [Penicillium subrubescens]|uniref:Major facilitator superfamily domain general substrate transporter n=1 Tax=Penicillium subrubescens TaxID=1316194 RepID=UPI002545085A|nr:Major facilitator superfamily domain general substrate transporter [Penicillium subrubescens]KAJ5886290.1 Major facilitator superfamily domain general substrate transporter [Penicillium subrubescens]
MNSHDEPHLNHTAPIDNPLSGIDLQQLTTIVERFHCRVGLENVVDVQTLLKGAQVAQDPDDCHTARLSTRERDALARENSPWFWQSRDLSITILATACAAITQGWQQSTINASHLFGWEKELRLENQLLIGLMNAAPWLSGSVIGTWLSDPLQERFFGRRPALFIAAIGSKASIAPVFAAEAAPDKQRGRVLMMWQLFDAFGIFLGFVCIFLVRDSWRALLATAIIPAIVLLFLVFVCPESPRFLIRRGRYPEAYISLRRLRGTDIQAARDLFCIHAQLQAETTAVWNSNKRKPWHDGQIYQEWIMKTHFFKRMWYLFQNPRTRRACMAAFIVMASQQLCAINVLAFYSSSLFDSDKNHSSVKWYNFEGFGLANFLFTFPAYKFIDNRGRRFLLLISFVGMTLSLIVVSGVFYITDQKIRMGLVTFFSVIIFTFFYSIGAGPIPFTLSAEVFPLCVREVGMSFSVMINFLGLGLLVLFVPKLANIFGRLRRRTKEQAANHIRALRPFSQKANPPWMEDIQMENRMEQA